MGSRLYRKGGAPRARPRVQVAFRRGGTESIAWARKSRAPHPGSRSAARAAAALPSLAAVPIAAYPPAFDVPVKVASPIAAALIAVSAALTSVPE
jgi:hypothetical protein